MPTNEQGIKVLGTPLGHDDFVAHHLRDVAREQQELLDKIPLVKDLQSAWLLLLHCAAARANYQLRSVRPSATEEFARTHAEGVWQCLANLLGTDLGQSTEVVRELATLPLRFGGLGLTSPVRIRGSAHWGSWADCLPMIHERHPEVAGALLEQLNGEPDTPCLSEAQEAGHRCRAPQDGSHPHGTKWQLGHVQKVSTRINSSHGTRIGVGSTKQHPEWNRGGCTSSSSQEFRNLQEL